MKLGRADAERIVGRTGWLAERPEAFRSTVLRRATLAHFSAGEAVFRFDDEPGGIYGIAGGIVTMTTAPRTETPRLVHLGEPGTWTGEACFVTREPRRVELRAAAVERHALQRHRPERAAQVARHVHGDLRANGVRDHPGRSTKKLEGGHAH